MKKAVKKEAEKVDTHSALNNLIELTNKIKGVTDELKLYLEIKNNQNVNVTINY